MGDHRPCHDRLTTGSATLIVAFMPGGDQAVYIRQCAGLDVEVVAHADDKESPDFLGFAMPGTTQLSRSRQNAV